jgi:hypothetical protein
MTFAGVGDSATRVCRTAINEMYIDRRAELNPSVLRPSLLGMTQV